MTELNWHSLASPNPAKEYFAVLISVPLKSFCPLPQFIYHIPRNQTELKSARGLIGYSLMAHLRADTVQKYGMSGSERK